MHPTLTLCLWFFAVLLTQRMPLVYLGGVLVVCLLSQGSVVQGHWWALLKKSRWLLLVLILTFALMTPGERFGFLPAAWPVTQEGVQSAGQHLVRLLAVLFSVAWLVGGRTTERLLAGFWGLAEVFRSAAMKRGVTRLALTLRYAAEGPSLDRSEDGWKMLLGELRGAATDAPSASDGVCREDYFEIDAQALPPEQFFLVLLSGVLTAALWWAFG